jgi:hypothetical protein
MPNSARREPLQCPVCGLALVIVENDEAPTVEYDMAEWGRLCRHPARGSPLVCPHLEPLINARRTRP